MIEILKRFYPDHNIVGKAKVHKTIMESVDWANAKGTI